MGKKFDLSEFAKSMAVSDSDTREQIEYIDLDLIDPDPRNFYELSEIDRLAANIELFGVQQPIRVRTDPEDETRVIVVSGHRRRAAVELLVCAGREDLRKVPCIREKDAGSEALQELRLIYANSDTRRMTGAEISRQAERVEALLYQLKEEGYDFPGRMRDHVAEACQVSKSKLARLKVIRENLSEEWMPHWEKGDINEAVAYALAKMSELHQHWALVSAMQKSKLSYFYEYSAERLDAKLSTLDEPWPCRRRDGAPPCDHMDAMREHTARSDSWRDECKGCCEICTDLLTCRDSCSLVKNKKDLLKSKAKAEKRRKAEEQEKEARPDTELVMALWRRYGKLRKKAGRTVEEMCQAMAIYHSDIVEAEVSAMEHPEQLEKKLTPSTNLPFGWSVVLSSVKTLIAAADALDCSLDELLCRDTAPVWKRGIPPCSGRYLVCFVAEEDPDSVPFELTADYDAGQDEFYVAHTLVDANCVGWWPIPPGDPT